MTEIKDVLQFLLRVMEKIIKQNGTNNYKVPHENNNSEHRTDRDCSFVLLDSMIFDRADQFMSDHVSCELADKFNLGYTKSWNASLEKYVERRLSERQGQT